MHASKLAQGKPVNRNRMHPDTIGSSAIRSDVDSQGARIAHTKMEHQKSMSPYLDQNLDTKTRTAMGHNEGSSAVSYHSNVTPNSNKRSHGHMQPLRAATMMKITKVQGNPVKARKASMDVAMSRN